MHLAVKLDLGPSPKRPMMLTVSRNNFCINASDGKSTVFSSSDLAEKRTVRVSNRSVGQYSCGFMSDTKLLLSFENRSEVMVVDFET